MTKKETKTQAKAAEQQATQRLMAIRQFNTSNAGEAYIDPDRTPTEEEINQAKKDFEEKTIALQNKKDYLIADAANAVRVATFLKNFIENGFWTQRYFVGVINFSEFISKFIEDAKKEPKDLIMEYGPMQFTYLMLENYAGFGIDAAKRFAEQWDEYVPIHDVLRDHIEEYQQKTEEIKKLQQRWGMFAQGYYLTYTDAEPDSVAEAPQPESPVEAPSN